jgi:heterotetrameric sarcosine oxidase gamma subunit
MADGLTLETEVPLHVASVRYFDAGGAFAAALTLAAGIPLPRPLAAAAGRSLVLAWLGPRETLALCTDGARLEELAAQLAEVPGGQVVDLRGGLTALRLEGARAGEFLGRLGGFGTVPLPGEARRGRLADVPVLALSLRPGEIQLVVDRAYAAHFLGWVRGTLEDFGQER